MLNIYANTSFPCLVEVCRGIILYVVDPSFILRRLNRAVRKAEPPKRHVQSVIIVLFENEIPLLDTAVCQTSSDVCCDLIYGAPYSGTVTGVIADRKVKRA